MNLHTKVCAPRIYRPVPNAQQLYSSVPKESMCEGGGGLLTFGIPKYSRQTIDHAFQSLPNRSQRLSKTKLCVTSITILFSWPCHIPPLNASIASSPDRMVHKNKKTPLLPQPSYSNSRRSTNASFFYSTQAAQPALPCESYTHDQFPCAGFTTAWPYG